MHFYFKTDVWEFYDLEKDPTEMDNLIDHPEYQKEIVRMKAELNRLMVHYQEPDYQQWKDKPLRPSRHKPKKHAKQLKKLPNKIVS